MDMLIQLYARIYRQISRHIRQDLFHFVAWQSEFKPRLLLVELLSSQTTKSYILW